MSIERWSRITLIAHLAATKVLAVSSIADFSVVCECRKFKIRRKGDVLADGIEWQLAQTMDELAFYGDRF
jgi:hypothetical protein